MPRYLSWPCISGTAIALVALGAYRLGAADVATIDDGLQHLHDSERSAAAYQALEENRARINGWMVALNEIPAPPFGEQARAEALVSLLRAQGLSDISVDAVGNVLARRPGRGGQRTLAVIAHIDTVFPAATDVSVRRDGDWYVAPGIADNSRGLAMMLALNLALEAGGWQTDDDILLVGSVGEEGLGDLRGVRHLFGAEGPAIDAAIVIDGGAAARVINEAVGSNRYRVTFAGPGGHSYGSFGLAHPHQALAMAIATFTRAASAITASDGAKATFSVGRIGGGTSINSIPFESWMEVDMRSADPARLAALDAAFQAALKTALDDENARRARGDALTLTIENVGQRPAGVTPADAPLVRTALRALALHGIDGELAASSTDANIPIAAGIPAITISRGGVSRGAHSLDERWRDERAIDSEKAALLLLLSMAGVSD